MRSDVRISNWYDISNWYGYNTEQTFGNAGATVVTRERIILIDPGPANTGWGIVSQRGAKLVHRIRLRIARAGRALLAFAKDPRGIGAGDRHRFKPTCVESKRWVRAEHHCGVRCGPGARCGARRLRGGESQRGGIYTSPIKLAVVGTGTADKEQAVHGKPAARSIRFQAPTMPPMRWPLPSATPPTKASADLRSKEQA